MVQAALNFGLSSTKLIVCCRAGQSRSSAIAFSILYEKFGKSKALAILNPKRHCPNSRVLQIADGLLDRPGILNAYDEWMGQNVGIRLKDYLDEIAAEHENLERKGVRDRIAQPRSK